jgi:hypothetical protein
VDRLNRYPGSQPVRERQRPVEALDNLLFLIRQTPSESEHLELYVKLAEEELERFKKALRQDVENPSHLR